MMHPDAVPSLFHKWPSYLRRRGCKRRVDCWKTDVEQNKHRILDDKEFSSSIEIKQFPCERNDLVSCQKVEEASLTHPHEATLSSILPTCIKASTSGIESFPHGSFSGSGKDDSNDNIGWTDSKKKTVKPLLIKQETSCDNEEQDITVIPKLSEKSIRKSGGKSDELPLVTTIPVVGREFIASVLAATSEDSNYMKKNDNNGPSVSSETPAKDKVIQLSGDHTYFEFKSPKKKVILKITKNPEKPTDRIKSLEELVDVLVRENLVSSQARTLIEAFLDLPSGLIRNRSQNSVVLRPHMKYTKGVEKFASTIYFHAPSAYEFVSKIFLLPELSAVRDTAKVWDYFPGFTQEAFSLLKNGFTNASSSTKLCSIMILNVKIEENLSFVADSGRYLGHVDFGGGQNPQDSDEVPTATDALLFIAVGLASNWKLPFGYFLNNSLSGEFLKTLVTEAIVALEDCNLEVRALVCSGQGAFLSLGNLLGCKIKVKSFRDIETSFPHPAASDRKVQLIFDASHGLKLLRNLLSDKGSLQSTTYGKIEWKFLSLILDIYESDKLEGSHQNQDFQEFNRQKMKVKVGSHSIGNSIGKTLELIEQQPIAEFEGYASTANFAADIDRAFDTLNSRNPVVPGERSPMYQYTVEEQKESLTFVARRIMGLELASGKRVVDEGRRMSVINFAFTLKGICYLASDLVNRNIIRYLCTYRLNLQHAEMILSCLKRRGGWCDHPTAKEFREAYKSFLQMASRVLSCNGQIFTSDFEGEDLTISQGIIYPYRNNLDGKVFDSINFIFSNSGLVDYSVEMMYRARLVAQCLAKRLCCSECIEILLDDDYRSIFVHSKTNDIYLTPSEYVLNLIKISEKRLKLQMFQSCSWQVEHLVSLVFFEYSQINKDLRIKKNSYVHYLEEPHHVICLSKAVIRIYLLFRQKFFQQISR